MFQLEKSTEVVCTNANVRPELHGEEKVRAIDLTFRLTGENHLLDLIQPGLREHYYRNKAFEDAVKSGQRSMLPDEVIPLPNVRYPLLPTSNQRWGDKKYRGYRWMWDWGTEAEHYDFTDVAVGSIQIEEIQEGGSVSILFTVQYNGEELNENETYGELAGLPCMGKIFIQLLSPPELVPAKKGYRAGKPDTPQQQPKDPNQPPLVGDGGATGDDDADVNNALSDASSELQDGSPEAALADAEAQVQAEATTTGGKRKRA